MILACGDPNAAGDGGQQVGVTAAAATVDFDESYVVMARKSVLVRQNATIHSGNVGVDLDSSRYPQASAACLANGLPNCYVGNTSHAPQTQRGVTANQGTKLFSDTMRLGRDTRVSEVFYQGALEAQANVQIGQSTTVSAAYFPLFPQTPIPQLAQRRRSVRSDRG